MSPQPARQWQPKHNPWLIAITVTLATFMEVLDTSIANVALPHIAGDLSAGVDESTWVLTSYLVSNAIVLPLSGWISNRIGRKKFYMICVALFGISSFLCGIAPSLGALIVCRVIQGIGGGGLAPSEQAILADTFEPAKRGIAFAVYGMAVVLAPAVGPTLGGYITDNFSWRWVFFINIPVALISLLLTSRLLEDPPWLRAENRNRKATVDYVGLGFIAVGLGALQVVLDKGEREDWFSSHFIVWFSIVSGVCLVAAVFWEYFQKYPIVDVRLFRERTFAISCTMMFVLGFALFGTTVLIPQLLQTLMGYTAQEAGMALSPGGFTVMLLMPVVGVLIQKVDARYLIAFGFLISALALWHMTSLSLEMNFGYAVQLRVFQSAGLAFLFVPINSMSYVGVPREKSNDVAGLTNLARNIGGSVGISCVTFLLARRSQVHQVMLSSHTSAGSDSFSNAASALSRLFTGRGMAAGVANQAAYGSLYSSVQRQAAVLAYIDTIWIFAICCAVMIPFAFVMKKNRKGGPVAAH